VAPLTGVPAPFVTVPVMSEVSSWPNAGTAIRTATMNKLRNDFIIFLYKIKIKTISQFYTCFYPNKRNI
jgi:hypothetical protein